MASVSETNTLHEGAGKMWPLTPNGYFQHRPHLSELASHLARLRPGHAAAHHITDLISMCGNYHRNPDVLRGNMEVCIQRIREART